MNMDKIPNKDNAPLSHLRDAPERASLSAIPPCRLQFQGRSESERNGRLRSHPYIISRAGPFFDSQEWTKTPRPQKHCLPLMSEVCTSPNNTAGTGGRYFHDVYRKFEIMAEISSLILFLTHDFGAVFLETMKITFYIYIYWLSL